MDVYEDGATEPLYVKVEAGGGTGVVAYEPEPSAAGIDFENEGLVVEDMVQLAEAFASHAHEGQVRKYTGEAYITHPAAVAALVRSVPHTEAMLAAAWLHDVAEDTERTLNDIQRVFGPEVAGLVEQLTDVSKPSDGNRAVRKAIDRARLAAASPEAQTIKLADMIDNTRSIAAHDPGFAKTYVAEKALLLEVMVLGDATLMDVARAQVEKKVFTLL